MEFKIEDEYYKRIIYKKRAIEQLSNILVNEFEKEKVFFVAGNNSYKKFASQIVNQFERAQTNYKTKILTKNENLDDVVKEAFDCKLIVALGGGYVCDFTKLLATRLNLEFIFVVSLPTNFGYFLPYAYNVDSPVFEPIVCKNAYKIIVDELFVCICDNPFVKSGEMFVASFYESLINFQVKELIFNDDKKSNDLKLVLAKLKDNHDYFKSGYEDSKLVLMDIIIDLGFIFKNVDPSYYSFCQFALLLNCGAVKNLKFGEICYFASSLMTTLYKKYFELKKIKIFDIPNFFCLSKSLKNLKLNSNYVNFSSYKKIVNNKEFFLKLNAVKNQILSFVDVGFENLFGFCEKQKNGVINQDKCFDCLNVLTYIFNMGDVFNAICSSGLINY